MLKPGGKCRIKGCSEIPEVKGITAEIVDIQTQEFESYTAYPLWVRMLSGVSKNRIYGFRYDEVEELT